MQARERMKHKFGNSFGLSSAGGGRMQGMGSDSNYRPAGDSQGMGLSAEDLSAQMSGAFSYLSAAIESGTKVSYFYRV